ncbi:hypothetical protein ID866_3456 [Astraeus odoratus]|nr:hypothetical protein ID866_3456 [Astraeus odoratus]
MALFMDHPFKHIFKGGVDDDGLYDERLPKVECLAIMALLLGHLIMKFMPQSIQVIHLTQTSVTALAIGALIFFVVKHHRSEGERRILTQEQEELVLIAAFGAFWLAFLLAMKAYNQSSIDVDLAHPRHAFSPSTGTAETNVVGAGSRRPPAAHSPSRDRYGDRPRTGYRKEYPCNPNDAYCVVEEWAFY